MQPWETMIDDAARLCGGQNELARRIGAKAPNLAQARAGRRPLTAEQLEAMAGLLGREPAELWEAQEMANMPRRNPFRRSAATPLLALIAVTLSALVAPDSSTAATTYARSTAGAPIYIVAHLRRLARACRQAHHVARRYLEIRRSRACAAA